MKKIINCGPGKDGITPSLACRFPPNQREAIQIYAATVDISEAEAVRQLIQLALDELRSEP
jgi:hypothetical protein